MKTDLKISLYIDLKINYEDKMILVKSLPMCSRRYGRMDVIDLGKGLGKGLGNGSMISRPILCCGHREVGPEECMVCRHVVHF